MSGASWACWCWGLRLRAAVPPGPYPFFTSCERQWLDADGEAVLATLGRRALGAGGCCATGGTYRSVDGRHWTPR